MKKQTTSKYDGLPYLRLERKTKGLTLKELASQIEVEESGVKRTVSESYLSKLENGESNAGQEVLRQLEAIFQVSADYLKGKADRNGHPILQEDNPNGSGLLTEETLPPYGKRKNRTSNTIDNIEQEELRIKIQLLNEEIIQKLTEKSRLQEELIQRLSDSGYRKNQFYPFIVEDSFSNGELLIAELRREVVAKGLESGFRVGDLDCLVNNPSYLANFCLGNPLGNPVYFRRIDVGLYVLA